MVPNVRRATHPSFEEAELLFTSKCWTCTRCRYWRRGEFNLGPPITVGQFRLGESEKLSISYEVAFVNTRISMAVGEGGWSKAAMLVRDPTGITFAPGCGKTRW